uniref:Transposase n=1 Tax=Heterorhabditis bacteriophora TaxID=37862 RepID=A0A1I7WCL6_HETBA
MRLTNLSHLTDIAKMPLASHCKQQC